MTKEERKIISDIVKKAGGYKGVSEITGHTYNTVKAELAPGRDDPPRWIKLLIWLLK